MRVIPAVFTRPGMDGDFQWMASQPEHSQTLFIFNDNEEQFMAFQYVLRRPDLSTASIQESKAFKKGGGNSIVRPMQKEWKAAGIPTGKNGSGYRSLAECQTMIDLAFEYIKSLLRTNRYNSIAFSATDSGTLGTSIYRPSPDVNQYITCCLYNLNNL